MPMLTPTRRDLLKLAAATPALAVPLPALALSGPGAAGNTAHFRFHLGQAKITVVSDGYLQLPTTGLGVNEERATVKGFLQAHKLSPTEVYSHTNHVIIEIGDHVVLIDVGSGDRFLDTAGRLMANLDSAGVDPAAISHVVITHAHPDHLWGIRDEFDEPIFPDAEYVIGQREYEFWMQDGLAASVPTEMQQFVVGAVNSLKTEGVEWTLGTEEHEVVPGVSLIQTPGHTPGHMSVRLESEGRQLIALGDSISHVHMSFEQPEWYNGFDMDGESTVDTRKRLLDMAANDDIAVVGYHFPFPGVGHVMRDGPAYRFVPINWRWG